jgi:hypothetical protein
MKKFFFLLYFVAAMAVTSNAQFYVVPDSNAVQLVNNFILSGVTATNVQYTGAGGTLGHFTNGSLTNLGMNDGIAMTTGSFDTTRDLSIGDTVGAFANYYNYSAGDSLLNTLIAPWQTYDASILEFDLNPVGNVLEFKYVFASEEYPEYVGSSFNDVFGFFISGPNPAGGNYFDQNIAIIPGTSLPVAINNVNSGLNSAYFVDNQALHGQTIIFDGFTTVLTAQISVIPTSTYHLKMAIADVEDGIFDSGIFLKAQSMKSYIITGIEKPESTSGTIYPNPIDQNSVLKVDLKQAGKIIVSITDHTGRLISQKETGGNQAGSVSLGIGQMMDDLSSGIYFIGIQTPDGSSTQKVVK